LPDVFAERHNTQDQRENLGSVGEISGAAHAQDAGMHAEEKTGRERPGNGKRHLIPGNQMPFFVLAEWTGLAYMAAGRGIACMRFPSSPAESRTSGFLHSE